jgi:3-oxoadipate enol-lactonase
MMDIEANGIRMHYTIEGSGPPVVLLHGFPLDRSMWEPQVRALSSRYLVIAPDLRGLGASSLGSVQESSMDLMADDVRALLDRIALRGPIVLGGLSMGGYVMFAFLRKYPQRVGALLLADTRATPDTEEGRRARLALAEQVERESSIQPIVDAQFPKLMAPANYDRPDLVARVRAMVARPTPAAMAAAQRGMAARPDSTGLLSEISCPTLIVVGEHDAFTPPSDSHAMHAAINGSELLEVPAAGHLAPLEEPEPVNRALLDFLERTA